MIETTNGVLLCPVCQGNYTHVNWVEVAAREVEDGHEHGFGICTEHCGAYEPAAVPVGARVGSGRRHRIVLIGQCENGQHNFGLFFTQHKGETFVETVELYRGDEEGNPVEQTHDH